MTPRLTLLPPALCPPARTLAVPPSGCPGDCRTPGRTSRTRVTAPASQNPHPRIPHPRRAPGTRMGQGNRLVRRAGDRRRWCREGEALGCILYPWRTGGGRREGERRVVGRWRGWGWGCRHTWHTCRRTSHTWALLPPLLLALVQLVLPAAAAAAASKPHQSAWRASPGAAFARSLCLANTLAIRPGGLLRLRGGVGRDGLRACAAQLQRRPTAKQRQIPPAAFDSSYEDDDLRWVWGGGGGG